MSLGSGLKKWSKEWADDFMATLEANEGTMAEMAALQVTCDQYEIDWADHPRVFEIASKNK